MRKKHRKNIENTTLTSTTHTTRPRLPTGRTAPPPHSHAAPHHVTSHQQAGVGVGDDVSHVPSVTAARWPLVHVKFHRSVERWTCDFTYYLNSWWFVCCFSLTKIKKLKKRHNDCLQISMNTYTHQIHKKKMITSEGPPIQFQWVAIKKQH